MATSFGEIYVGDACITVGQSGSLQQVIYPVTGGYKLGWINSNYSPTPAPISYKDEEKNIGPVASGAFSGKTIIATALNDVDLGYDGSIQRKISKFDICIITNVDSSTALCTVEYPVNATDATNCSTTRTVSNISLNNFINYNGSAQAETTTIPEQLTAYPTYDMVNTVGSNTTNWWLDPGDTYTTINKIDGKSEVLYYCSQGRHAGKWKLGWVWLDYYSLDLNGYIDGALVGDLQKYGYADIYINGILRTKYANDFYSANGTFPRGSTYEIKNIAAYDGHTYNGVYSGSLKGTLTGNASCALNFTKDAATLYDIYVSQKPTKLEYLEGSTLNTSGLIVTATYSDGSTSDVTSSCTFSGFESNVPGVQTIDVKYQGKTASFTVKVEGKSPTTLSIESMPNKLKYRVGEEFSWEGLSVKASYNNGTSANVNNYDVIADDHLTDSTGIKTIIVAYCYNDIDVSTSFDIKVVEGKTPKITTDGIKTIAGELFSVPIKLSDNPGIASLKIKVAYDSNLITLNSVKYNTDMGGNAQEPQKLTSPVTLNWFNGATNYNGDCVFATLTFTALDSITESKTTSFTITYNDNDIYNIDEDNLGLTLDLGEIEIDPAIESLITYNANGGSKEPASQTKKYKQDIKLSDVIPEREEYTFLGWAVSSDETTPVYQPGDVYSDDHDLVLYAVWEKVSHVHDYHAVITDPTCTEKGYTTYTCSCGDSYVGNYTSELGHDYDAWMSVSDTQHRGVCKHDSSHVLVENHVWNDGVVTTEATCTEKGVMTYTCSICGDTYNVDIPVKGHSYGIWIPNDNGSHTRICENNKNHKETANCEYEYKVVTAATYTKEGTGSFTCKYCGVSGNLFSRNPGN